jgi:hypothetical protein
MRSIGSYPAIPNGKPVSTKSQRDMVEAILDDVDGYQVSINQAGATRRWHGWKSD